MSQTTDQHRTDFELSRVLDDMVEAARAADRVALMGHYRLFAGAPGSDDTQPLAVFLTQAGDAARRSAAEVGVDLDLAGIHELVKRAYPACQALVPCNLAVLECLVRSVVGMNDYLAGVQARPACLQLAVLAGVLTRSAPVSGDVDPVASYRLSDDRTPGSEHVPPGSLDAVIERVRANDAPGWYAAAGALVAADEDSAVAAAADTLLNTLESRLDTAELDVPAAVALATAVSSGFTDTPFECEPYLLEFAVRKAVGEPGCEAGLDALEFVLAAAQLCAALNLCADMFPNRWPVGVFISDGPT